MNTEISFRAFVWAVILGMGFTLGSGAIRLVARWIAQAVGTDASF